MTSGEITNEQSKSFFKHNVFANGDSDAYKDEDTAAEESPKQTRVVKVFMWPDVYYMWYERMWGFEMFIINRSYCSITMRFYNIGLEIIKLPNLTLIMKRHCFGITLK